MTDTCITLNELSVLQATGVTATDVLNAHSLGLQAPTDPLETRIMSLELRLANAEAQIHQLLLMRFPDG